MITTAEIKQCTAVRTCFWKSRQLHTTTWIFCPKSCCFTSHFTAKLLHQYRVKGNAWVTMQENRALSYHPIITSRVIHSINREKNPSSWQILVTFHWNLLLNLLFLLFTAINILWIYELKRQVLLLQENSSLFKAAPLILATPPTIAQMCKQHPEQYSCVPFETIPFLPFFTLARDVRLSWVTSKQRAKDKKFWPIWTRIWRSE